jgi:hypothetical protein
MHGRGKLAQTLRASPLNVGGLKATNLSQIHFDESISEKANKYGLCFVCFLGNGFKAVQWS